MKNKMKSIMNQEHEGAVAFEYMIILVIMGVAIFASWDLMADGLQAKAVQITEFIKGNGQTQLSN